MPKLLVFFLAGIIAAIGLGVWYHGYYSNTTSQVVFEGVSVKVELADTPKKRAQGLSGRTSLSDETGMLFVYEEPGRYDFHMKDMNFSIDIIWMDETGKVVDITRSLSPDSYPGTVTSRVPAHYVLEVPAGFSRRHNVGIGDIASLRYD